MMKFGTIEFAAFPRAELRKLLASQVQTPPQYIDEVVDLAVHAADCGSRAMLEVLDRASHPGVSVTAIGMAASLLRSRLEMLEAGLKEGAKHAGLRTYEGSVKATSSD